jgi:hypothetical protein
MKNENLRKRTDGKGHKESDAMPETTFVRRRLPTTAPRRSQTGGRPGRTIGGGSTIRRGQLKPRTLTLRTSHFPDPPAATIQPTNTTAIDTERRRLHDSGRRLRLSSPPVNRPIRAASRCLRSSRDSTSSRSPRSRRHTMSICLGDLRGALRGVIVEQRANRVTILL